MTDTERLARAVLLFHRGGAWTVQDREDWQVLTGKRDCTTRALCDFARQILDTGDRPVATG
jgi:hypothetical protein